MTYHLRKSAIDPALFEIVAGSEVIAEIPVSFCMYRWPRNFPSLEAARNWIQEEERKLAKKAAFRLLAAKSQSSSCLKQKLLRKGFSAHLCEEIVQEMERLGYVSDEDLAIFLIEREIQRGHGPFYIEMKFRSLGIDSSKVRRIATDERQREAIRKWLPKLKNPGPALQRRGFDGDLVLSELKNFLHKE